MSKGDKELKELKMQVTKDVLTTIKSVTEMLRAEGVDPTIAVVVGNISTITYDILSQITEEKK